MAKEMEAPALPTAVQLLDWDSAHFGLRIGRVMATSLTPDVANEVLACADLFSMDCLYLLADSKDHTTLRLANETGWRMVDVRVTLGAKLCDVVQGSASVRLARTSDIPYLKDLAARSHKDSRFYSDGNFAPDACDDMFATWIERSVVDPHFAGAVFVPQFDDAQAVGYITCAIKEDVGDIGLLAVDQRARGRGMGMNLLAEASRWFAAQGAERVSVVTQGCNIAALRMYDRHGFAIESIHLWFHWWRDPKHRPI